jgi:hypothetical protein
MNQQIIKDEIRINYKIIILVLIFIFSFGCKNKTEYSYKATIYNNLHSKINGRKSIFESDVLYKYNNNNLEISFKNIDNKKIYNRILIIPLKEFENKEITGIDNIFVIKSATEIHDGNNTYYFRKLINRYQLLYIKNSDWSISISFIYKDDDLIRVLKLLKNEKKDIKLPIAPQSK